MADSDHLYDRIGLDDDLSTAMSTEILAERGMVQLSSLTPFFLCFVSRCAAGRGT